MRGAIAGIARLRRPAAPPSSATPTTKDLQSPTPPRRALRRPSAAAATSPARSGWIARWFGLSGRRSAPSRRLSFPDDGSPDFTPEKYPGLSAEACAILNTPVEECPPEVLRILLTALANDIADQLPPELGLSDPETLFATLWGRLAGPLGEAHAAPDVEAAAPPDEAPATPADAVPDARLLPPDKRPEPQTPGSPDHGAIAGIAASAATAHVAVLPKPDCRRSRSRRHGRCQLVRECRTRVSRSLRDGQQHRPPPQRTYHTGAGPP